MYCMSTWINIESDGEMWVDAHPYRQTYMTYYIKFVGVDVPVCAVIGDRLSSARARAPVLPPSGPTEHQHWPRSTRWGRRSTRGDRRWGWTPWRRVEGFSQYFVTQFLLREAPVRGKWQSVELTESKRELVLRG